ncbi:MMPL family transporter [Schaalia vaccimaxillae]|uniref:MMPL family transporter n=1 Tax=Schaalia vaccimaxillae TaxID=183916 RepID=UPI0003B3C03A|nr:MMPL family transporter [Schaalia vaccimaxillae]
MLDKIAGFIVDRRGLVVSVMAFLTIVASIFIPRVGVITDQAEFLPSDSQMRRGLDLMDQQWPNDIQPRTVRVMFTGLDEDEEQDIHDELAEIPGVSQVEWEAGAPQFHSGEHTLYIVNTEYDYDSPQELAIEQAIHDRYGDDNMVMRNDNPSPASELPTWILIAAIGMGVIILFVMCASWLEPILFLAAIGMAVLLNLGTNIFRGSIAEVTFTIGAILQLVLSMDYSIILMNRYRQEKAAVQGRANAMKKALRHSFSAISSASVTTVVGLLMLCFMSMTIGADLGIALAKGVFISMICVFTVLPALILWSDKLIDRTTKPFFEPNLKKLAGFEYRFRWPLTAIFAVLFVGSYILSSQTPVVYTLAKEDPVAEVFPVENEMVFLYKNDAHDSAAKLADDIEDEDEVRAVASYPSTLGRQRTISEMTDMLDTMGARGQFDATTLGLVYYFAHDGAGVESMTVPAFVSFLTDDVAKNRTLSRSFDKSNFSQIEKLKKFTNPTELTARKNATELAQFLGLGQDEATQILLAYYIAHGVADPGTMSLPGFVSFVTGEVARDPEYGQMFDRASLRQLRQLSTYTDAAQMTRQADVYDLAELMRMDPQDAAYVLMYREAIQGNYAGETMTLPTFVSLVRNDVATNPEFFEQINAEQVQALDQLAPLTEKTRLTTPLNAQALASAQSMDPALVGQIFALKAMSEGRDPASVTTMSVHDFTTFLVDSVLADPSSPAAAAIPSAEAARLKEAKKIMDLTVSETQMTPVQMAGLTGMDPAQLGLLYAYGAMEEDAESWSASPHEFIHFLLDQQDTFGDRIADQADQLQSLAAIIDTSIASTQLTPSELAGLLGTDADQARQLYLLHISRHGDTTSWGMNVQNFLGFIVDELLTNPDRAKAFSASEANQLRGIRALVDAVVGGKSLPSAEMAGLFSGLERSVDAQTVELLYLLRAVMTEADPSWTLSLDELFDHLQSDVLADPRFDGLIDEGTRDTIAQAETQINEGLEQLVGPQWSRLVITTIFEAESPETSQFVDMLFKRCRSDFGGDCYLVGNSIMTYEMSESFGSENLMITLLTALAIFIVVALTFRSLSVPLLLVLLVQCGVFITVTTIGLQGYDNYYLAQLMVQCILMGATIDYGIVLTTYYRRSRKTMGIAHALSASYDGSIHTILTSGSIMIFVTGILGYLFENPTIAQICRTISIGALAATLLIIVILPGLLAAFDSAVAGKGRLRGRH